MIGLCHLECFRSEIIWKTLMTSKYFWQMILVIWYSSLSVEHLGMKYLYTSHTFGMLLFEHLFGFVYDYLNTSTYLCGVFGIWYSYLSIMVINFKILSFWASKWFLKMIYSKYDIRIWVPPLKLLKMWLVEHLWLICVWFF